MDAFVRKFCEKYSLPITVSLQLLEKMEKFSFRKGDFLVQEGERNSNFYIISKGIWRGHYLSCCSKSLLPKLANSADEA